MSAIEPDDRSRRCFLKASSKLGLAVAFKAATIGEAFAESRIAGKEDTMTQSSATQRDSEQATDKTTIRPFQVNCSRSGTYRIAQAHQRDKVA